jgi:hypothetical protein
MMRLTLGLAFCALLCGEVVLADPDTDIYFSVTELGLGQWEYTYDVHNDGLVDGIEEFTIWFDYGLYDNLVVTTPDPPSSDWDEIVWDVEPVLGDPGGYDALANASNLAIEIGENVYGFAVSFDWLGVGDPGSQYYEIINPDTFVTIEDGYTAPIPEPATLCLLGLGSLSFIKRRKV